MSRFPSIITALLLKTLFVSAVYADDVEYTTCPEPSERVQELFDILERNFSPRRGDRVNPRRRLANFLSDNLVAIDARNEDCETPLHVVIRNNDRIFFEMLYSYFREPSLNRPFGEVLPSHSRQRAAEKYAKTLFNYALLHGNVSMIDRLEKLGGNFYEHPKFREIFRMTNEEAYPEEYIQAALVLHNTSDNSGDVIKRYALDNDEVSLNHFVKTSARENWSLMHIAAKWASYETFLMLSSDFDGRYMTRVMRDRRTFATPAFLASMRADDENQYQIFRYIMENDGSFRMMRRVRVAYAPAPTHYLAKYNRHEALEEVIERLGSRAALNAGSPRFNAPLVNAIKADHFESVEVLVRSGARVNETQPISSEEEKKYILFAESEEMKNFLIDLGAKPPQL